MKNPNISLKSNILLTNINPTHGGNNRNFKSQLNVLLGDRIKYGKDHELKDGKLPSRLVDHFLSSEQTVSSSSFSSSYRLKSSKTTKTIRTTISTKKSNLINSSNQIIYSNSNENYDNNIESRRDNKLQKLITWFAEREVDNNNLKSTIGTTSQVPNNSSQQETDFRKGFIKKQQQLRKKNRIIDDLLNRSQNNSPSQPKIVIGISNLTKSPSTIQNYSTTNTQKFGNSSKVTNGLNKNIVLSLDKYKLDERSNEQTASDQKTKTMVNIPLAVKKYNTFNENDVPSHKELAKHLINGDQNGSNEKIIFVNNKPITKTNSNINLPTNKARPIIRRAPKEFLSATINTKETNKLVKVRPSSKEELNGRIEYTSTSPITKSLPSYDEALKRAVTQTTFDSSPPSKVNNITNQSSPNLILNNLINNHHKSTDQNGSTNVQSYLASSAIVKNSRHLLPTIPMQSTFKSLLTIPISNSAATSTNGHNGTTLKSSNYSPLGAQSSSKIYFKPQDLSESKRSLQTSEPTYLNQKPTLTRKIVINTSPTPIPIQPIPSPRIKLSTKQSTSDEQKNETSTNLINTNNQVTTTTSSTLVTTQTTTTLTENNLNRNSMIQGRAPTPEVKNLKSWASINKLPTADTEHETVDKNKPFLESSNLTNWRSTAALNNSNQNERHIIIECKSPQTQESVKDPILKSGKLMDAVSAVNSIDDGLALPMLGNKNLNNNNKQMKENNSNKIADLNKRLIASASTNDIVDDVLTSSSSSSANLDDSNDSELNYRRNANVIKESHLLQPQKKEFKQTDLGRIQSGLNDARYNFRSSTNTTDSGPANSKNTNGRNDFADRPPGRLNYYDSESNTFSEGLFVANGNGNSKIKMLKHGNNKNQINKDDGLSDSPNLSDITEGKFDDIENGHRTSTPNLSSRKQTNSSSSEIKQLKKQLQELERMYYEILRIIDPDKNSLSISTNSAQSSTSLSSFNSSTRGLPHTKNRTRNSKNSRNSKNQDSHHKKFDPNDINNLKHRFGRMESHLTSLAKTVAQISVELKSIRSIEEIIYNLNKDIQELKNQNFPGGIGVGLSNSSINRLNKSKNKNLSDLQRSLSEPNIINLILNGKHKDEEKRFNSLDRRQDSAIDREAFKANMPNYSNPRKLKKLTKFFGQEPPMLRIFLQKLNYEIYAQNFEIEHITITELPYLSEERLKALGIPLGPRLRILKEAQHAFRQETF